MKYLAVLYKGQFGQERGIISNKNETFFGKARRDKGAADRGGPRPRFGETCCGQRRLGGGSTDPFALSAERQNTAQTYGEVQFQ